jgi:hypothetical protein
MNHVTKSRVLNITSLKVVDYLERRSWVLFCVFQSRLTLMCIWITYGSLNEAYSAVNLGEDWVSALLTSSRCCWSKDYKWSNKVVDKTSCFYFFRWSWAWWYIPVFPPLGMLRQEEHWFKARLSFLANLKPFWTT